MSKKMGYMLLSVFSLLLVIFLFNWLRTNTDDFGMLQSFSVTINNQSDYDIVSVETGMISSLEKHSYAKIIKAGDTV